MRAIKVRHATVGAIIKLVAKYRTGIYSRRTYHSA